MELFELKVGSLLFLQHFPEVINFYVPQNRNTTALEINLRESTYLLLQLVVEMLL
jgi:hypothetical protein